MNIRPHHILCIQKFTGHGYNEEFTDHMKEVVSRLRSKPETYITVREGCDDLCRMCPNQEDGACTSLEKVNAMDTAVLRVCGIAYEDTVSWEKIANQAQTQILETDIFLRICADCQWTELCRNTEISYESHKRK